MERLVVTPEEAAGMLITSPSEIRRLIHEGELPAYKSGRNFKIVIAQLQQYVERKAIEEAERRKKECQR